jgi:hypothetical protein
MLTLENKLEVKRIGDYGVTEEIKSLIKKSGLDEPFDWINVKHIIQGKYNNELVGIVVYGETNTQGKVYPRFMHVIFNPKYKRTKKALDLMILSEQEIKKLGFDQIIVFIWKELNNKDMKEKYALKFGYKHYADTSNGKYFYKNI